MKLTAQSVSALVRPTDKADHVVWDDELPGFGVRLRGDSKRWVIQYRVGIAQRREILGDVRKVRIEDARKIARQRFAQAELGVDPAAEKTKARVAAAAAKLTLASVADGYLAAKQQAVKNGSYTESTYEVHWQPLRNRPIDSIKRAEVAKRLQELTTQYGRSAAGKARYTLSALYTWAMGEGLCESNPVVATNNPEAGVLARERVLTDGEIRAVWSPAWMTIPGGSSNYYY